MVMGGDMFRHLLMRTAVGGVLAFGIPTGVIAQPPRPPEAVHRVGEGIKNVVKKTDRAIRHVGRRTTHAVRRNTHRVTRHTVRAACNDGTIRAGRTRAAACAGHEGVRR